MSSTQPIIESYIPAPVDKSRIAASFSRSAASYDSVAQLQQQVGYQLLEKLPKGFRATTILDAGCGTGYFTGELTQRYNPDQIHAIDLADGMLSYAANKTAEADLARTHWAQTDVENLPFADNSFDLIYSSLVVQWCADLEAFFREAKRVLKPGGILAFSTLGPRTLYELKEAWKPIDQHVHVNEFMPYECVDQLLSGQSFTSSELSSEDIVLQYQRLNQLTKELKSLGAHNMNEQQSSGLTGKNRIKALIKNYEQFRSSDGILPATYEVYYGVAVA
ncbi:MAG: malonyl-ACP O-methyltransferase BioC [Pseudomonadales bacterium]|nr:malonyl-ACP O-methyltransferase BioC [Pseudomonadales bacterium]